MSKPEKAGIITRREYNWLKSFSKLEPHEQKKVKYFEDNNTYKPFKIPDKKVSKKVSKTPQKKIEITKSLIWKFFKIFFKAETGTEFQETPDAIKNISPIINYFALNDDFFNCVRLVGTKNKPSYQKGLLIIGKFGNGKSTIMKVLSKIFNHYKMPMRFKAVSSHDLVTEWEAIQNPGGKSLYFERYLCKVLYIDDVKKEKIASNYGKTDVIKDIIEKRYDKKLKTYITCNYRESDNDGNLDDALMEFNRYGNHIYDRLFEMFNIIEFKGESFRK